MDKSNSLGESYISTEAKKMFLNNGVYVNHIFD